MLNNPLLAPLCQIAEQAGQAIVEIYQQDDLGVQHKADHSPLTAADQAAHHLIEAALQALTPEIPVYSEESTEIPYHQRQHWPRFWLVDPLDGTKEFIQRNGEFTVNIALIEDGQPTLGVVHVPVTGVTYAGDIHQGAIKIVQGQSQPIHCRARTSPVVMVASRRHGGGAVDALEQYIQTHLGPVQRTAMGSSLKLCLVAEGQADIYPRLAPTCEWDTAAAHAVVSAAGGQVVDCHFAPLCYNKKNIFNPNFLVLGQAVADWQFIAPALAEWSQ